MSFNAKNPFISPKTAVTPTPPMPGTEGLYPGNDGWYRIDEHGNIYKVVTDNNYVHTDNNFSNNYKNKIEENSNLVSAALETGNTAISIAQGANQAKSFNTYGEMVEWFNQNLNWGEIDNVLLDYQIGQNIMIGTVNVPDVWIAELPYSADFIEYIYTTEEDFANDLKTAVENGEFLRVGYVRLGILETQKVDLTDYIKDENYVHTDNNYTDEEKKIAEMIYNKDFFISYGFYKTVGDFGIEFVIESVTGNNYIHVILLSGEEIYVPVTIGTPIYIEEISESMLVATSKYDDYVGRNMSWTKNELLSEINENGEVRAGYFGYKLTARREDYEKYASFINSLHYDKSIPTYLSELKNDMEYVVLDDMNTAISNAIKNNNGKLIVGGGSFVPEPNNVYTINGDTTIILPTEYSEIEEYYFSIDTSFGSDGNITPSIAFENVIKWSTPFEIKADTHYEIAIRNGYGVIAEFNEVGV